ncbi:MAG: hypothetical protein ACPGXK_15200, partial [Phycisphaerae bacterium]
NFKGGPGAGLYCDAASPLVERTVITGNYVGGIACENGSAPIFANCLIADNHGASGGALRSTGFSHPQMIQCTIAGNTAQWSDGGISTNGVNNGVVRSSIHFGNTPASGTGTSTVVFTNVEAGASGAFNKSEDPGFRFTHNGTWSSVNEATAHPQQFRFVDLDATFVPGELVGAIANVATDSQVQLGYPIVANTEKSITIWSSGYFLAEVFGNYKITDYRLGENSPCINAAAMALEEPVSDVDLMNQPRIFACRADMGALESPFIVDCDNDGGIDACDARRRQIEDCNENFIPDSCEADCDLNGITDSCEIQHDVQLDINGNDILDLCEIGDCDLDGNSVVDEVDRDLMRDCLAGLEPREGECPDIDLNDDGEINKKDMDVFARCYDTFRVRPADSRLSSN